MFWYNDTSSGTSCEGIQVVWPSSHKVDVPHGEVHESIERIHKKHGTTRGQHGDGVFEWRKIRVLHIIQYPRGYVNKEENVGW